MVANVQSMSVEEIGLSLRSAQLEQVYEKALAHTEQIYGEERARSLRVQLLLLEDENDELREQMHDDEDEMKKLETTNDELHDHLKEVEFQYQAVQMDLKAQLREIDRYKAEINAFSAASADSTKLLSEKLALSRELTTLKAELDHLKSQTTTQQSLLGEKLALERELSAVQVELETEKRTVQRLKAKNKNASSADAALTEEIEELRRDLTKERRVAKEAAFKDAARVERIEELEQDLSRAKRIAEKPSSTDAALAEEVDNLKKDLEKERRKNSNSGSDAEALSAEIEELKKEISKSKRDAQKVERENLKKSVEWDTQKESLETKLDAFRNKLRTTKEQLKEAHDELEKAEQAKFAAITEASKARLSGANPLKRNVARFDPDMTIGTPGHGGATKKQRVSVNTDDKSNFSITPFLNKTMSILPESPEDRAEQNKVDIAPEKPTDSVAEDGEKHETTASASATTTTVSKKAKGEKKAPAGRTKTKTTKVLQDSTNPKVNAVVKKPSLPKVTEESEEVEDSQQSSKDPESSSLVGQQPKKKISLNKRPTIFDDEEENTAPKRTKKLNLGGLKGSGLSLGKVNLGTKGKVLAEFSPLKKDRKAVVAL